MTGEAVTISNIEKKIKDGIDIISKKVQNVDFKKHGENLKESFDTVTDNITETVKSVDFEKRSNQLKDKSQIFFETIGDIITFFLKLFAKFFGVIMIFAGIVTLLALLITLFSFNIIDAISIPGIDIIDIIDLTNTPRWLMSILLFFAFSIPFFFLFYLGLKIIVSNLKPLGSSAKFTLLGIWIITLFSFIIIGVKQINEHSHKAYESYENELNITAQDTLKIKMNTTFFSTKRPYVNSGDLRIFKDENGKKIIANNNVKFIIRSTNNKIGKIEITKNAHGNNYENASQHAKNIFYNYNFKNKALVLDEYLTTDSNHKLRNQSIQIIIYLPKDATLYADKNTYKYHRNSSVYNDILHNGMEEKYMIVKDGRLICDSCQDEYPEDVIDDNSKNGIQIDEDGIKIKTDTNNFEINENGIQSNSENVDVKIDENGIKITTKNNNR